MRPETATLALAVALENIQKVRGETGPRGPKGDIGERGAEGPQGKEGSRGPKGERGPKGADGRNGEPGLRGERGPKGDKGDKGDTVEGAGIAEIEFEDDRLEIKLTDGREYKSPRIKGRDGMPGVGLRGPDGPKGNQGDPGEQGPPGEGVAAGGTTGQVLAKNSDDDYDTTWITPGGGGGAVWGGITGTLSAQTDLQSALDAKYDASNPNSFISGIDSGMVTTALGFTPYSAANPSGYISGITGGDVTTALGYTPASTDVFTDIDDGLAPASGGGTTNFLRADGTWAAPPGGGAVDWGDIGGTLSDQTDLQTALNAKVNASGISGFGATLIDDADAAAARSTLGLGTLATQSGTFSGTSSGTNTGDQTITLTGDVTGSGTGSFATAIGAGVIVNADVNASAAIAVSKLAAVTASRALVSDASGFVSASAVTATELGYVSGVTSAIQAQFTGKQASNANLTAFAGLSLVADRLPYANGTGTLALATFTAGGRALVNSAGTANTFPYFSASNTVTLGSVTAAGRALIDDADAAAQRTTLGVDTVTINFIIDGGGSAITTGVKGDIVIDFACTIQSWTLLSDQSGSIVVDIWKDSYANYPPVVGDSITASAKPTISTATKGQSSTLTGWTTSITAGQTLRINVDSITTCQRVTLSLKVVRA